jgi:hypothetical protein
VVWIDGGLHATEVLGAQQLIETIHRLNTKTDPETLRILNDTVILCTLVNPDGMELVSNWYMRDSDEKKRSTGGIPRLYQKYIGHDDNRDFYMMNMSESTNANKMMYREWFPVDHVQPSPDRPGRRGALRAALPRSVQLQLRSADRARHRHGRLGHSHAARGRRQARRGDAIGDELLDLVQRRHPDDVVFPQPDWHPDRNDRQPDAGRDSVRARHAAAARGRAEPDPAADVLFQGSDRVLGHQQLRDPRHRVEAPRRLSLQHVQDGEERHRQGQSRQLDDSSEAHRSGA